MRPGEGPRWQRPSPPEYRRKFQGLGLNDATAQARLLSGSARAQFRGKLCIGWLMHRSVEQLRWHLHGMTQRSLAWYHREPCPQEPTCRTMQAYAMLNYMDDVIGRLFDYLVKHDMYKDTYVLLMGDNGVCLARP